MSVPSLQDDVVSTDSLPGESWLPIPGWEGMYEVSDLGRVRSLPRKNHPRLTLLASYPMKRGGYTAVSLSRDNHTHTSAVHKLVALAFLGPRPDGMEVRHLNGDATDPRLVNLAYGTPSENQRDRLRHGTHHYGNRTHCNNGHPFDEENTYLYPRGGGRRCRICQRERLREYKRARRAAEKAAR